MFVCDTYKTKKYALFSVAYMSCARILKQQASCIYHQTLHEFIYKVTIINIGRQNWYIFFVIITFYFIEQIISLYTSNIKMATMSICKIGNYQMKLLFLLQDLADWQSNNKENQVKKKYPLENVTKIYVTKDGRK